MYSRVLGVTFAATACFLGAHTARADLPADRTVYLYMYEVPGDPESDIVFSVGLDLEAVDVDGVWVGWEVTSAKFIEPGTPDTVWIENSPAVDSPDGLWWVEHVDLQDPQHDEFTLPPLLEGTATAEEPLGADLEYTLEGASYDPPPGGPPFDVTAAVDYIFTVEGEEDPKKEGDDEPVEVPPGTRPTE